MTSLASGSRIGGYEIVAPLRAGGMASFYLARRVGPAGFTRPIGIKIVHAHLAQDRAFVDMFLGEARLSARIVHPNVVHVEELGEAEGIFFLAMELVHGAPLSALLRRLSETQKALTVPVACAIAMRVADGLHAAHEVRDDAGAPLDVVHRNVSPQNILIGADGQVKLMDFGMAKVRGRVRKMPSRLRYMSPEHARGEPIDRRTDVYALGIVLWESLTMRRLFGGESDVATFERVRAPSIPNASEFEDSVSPSIDAVLETALATDAADRFDTAQSFRRVLGHACPEAAKVEPDEIGALVRTLLAEDLERERALLGAFPGAVPDVRTDDAERANHTIHSTRQSLSDAPVATIAPTRVGIAVVDPPKPRSPIGIVLALGALLAIAGIAFVAWPRTPPGPCDAMVTIAPGDGARVLAPFDNRVGSTDWVLHDMRHPTALPMRTAVFAYTVPGTGPRTVEIDSAIAETDARFDTMIGVFHGACDPSMATREPDIVFDDDDDLREFRASGALRADAGDVLTIVVTGYGGHVLDHIDEGPGAIAITASQPRSPTLESASVRLEAGQIYLEVAGDDPDGDTVSARLRFEGREGAPIAVLRFPDSSRAPGHFAMSATLDVGEQGQRNMSTAEIVEVAVTDVGGNASPPLTVPVVTTEPDAGAADSGVSDRGAP